MLLKDSSMIRKKRFLTSNKHLKPKETSRVRSGKLLRNSLSSSTNPTSKFLIFTSKRINLEKNSSKTDMNMNFKVIDADGSEE